MFPTGSTLPGDRPRYAWGLVLLALAAYAPALRAGFIWDDSVLVGELPLRHGIAGLWDIWAGKQTPDYFPLTFTSFWIERQLFGASPFVPHLTNILLHGLSAVMLGRILQKLEIPGAWLAAALFVVHPVNVPSVAWISERKNTLSLVFYLLALGSYLEFLRGEGNSRRRYLASAATFALALLSKTSTVALPVTLLACAWWQKNRLGRRQLFNVLPFVLLAVGMGLVTVWFQYTRALEGGIARSDGPAARLAVAGWAVWFYLGKIVFPVNLSLVYPRWQTAALSLAAYGPALAVLASGAGLWKFRHGWARGPFLAYAFFLAHLLPVLGFVQMSYMRLSLVADHFQYIAAIGIIACAAAGATRLAAARMPSGVQWGAAMVLMAVLGLMTFSRARLFRDGQTVWRAQVEQHPELWIGHLNLATELDGEAKDEEAIKEYRWVLQLAPATAQVHKALGRLLMRTGNSGEALPLLAEAARRDPKSAEAQNNLGVALMGQKRWQEAQTHFEAAIALRPGDPEPRANLRAVLQALEGTKHSQATSNDLGTGGARR